jgi:hypothetical protein
VELVEISLTLANKIATWADAFRRLAFGRPERRVRPGGTIRAIRGSSGRRQQSALTIHLPMREDGMSKFATMVCLAAMESKRCAGKMTPRPAILVSALLLVGMASEAQASLTISRRATKDVSCSAGVCTATAGNAFLNASDLAGMLASGDVTVVPGRKAMDIDVAMSLSWASAHLLTLDAYRSIIVAQPVTITGSGGLTLKTGHNKHSIPGLLIFSGRGRVTFWDLHSSFRFNGLAFQLVNSVAMLESAVAVNPGGRFALAKSYDAKNDGTYPASPISDFSGFFEGLGNAISDVAINDTSSGDVVGFFSSSFGILADFQLLNINIASNSANSIGGLVGANNGAVEDVLVTGKIQANAANSLVGGLVGHNGGSMAGIGTAVTITDYANNASVGGLVGLNNGAILAGAAAGSVSGDGNVGGFVGFNGNTISSSYASATVSGGQGTTSAFAGGFVGKNQGGNISLSHASGSVSSNDSAGGFAGINQGAIGSSYSTGAAQIAIGGAQQFRTSGGFVGTNGDGSGNNPGSIVNCYEFGPASVSGSGGSVGGFAGFSGPNAQIRAAYSIGFVSAGGGNYLGGFVGQDNDTLSATYWDTDTSGVSDESKGAGNVDDDGGVTGLTTEELQFGLPAGFDSAIWGEDDFTNNGLPYLLALKPGRAR